MGSPVKTKECQGCETVLPLECFPSRKDRSGRLRPYCYDCSSSIERARYNHHKKVNPFKHKATRAKTRATNLGVPFDLDGEYLESIWTGKCPAFEVPIRLDTDRKDELAAELDRFIPELGYIKGNVTFLSRKANRIKNNVSVKEIKKLCQWMETRQDKSE